MKLLLDQNISYRLVKKIEKVFPGTDQVKRLGLQDSSDYDIWKFARDNRYTIVTFDTDFIDLNTLYGAPPKIVLIRTGNYSTSNLSDLLINKVETISEYLADDSKTSCLRLIE